MLNSSRESVWRDIPLLEAAGMLLYGPDNRILAINAHACRTLGCAEEDLVGKTIGNYFTKFITPDGMLVSSDGLPVARVLREKKAQGNRVLGILGLGERGVIWSVISAFPVFATDGSVSRVVLTLMEFDNEHGKVCGFERDNTEKALHDLLEFNRQIIAGGGEGIVVFNKDLRYVLWNPFMENLTGFRQDEVLGKKAFEIFSPLRDPEVATLLARALEGETVAPQDFRFQIPQTGKNGWISVAFTPHKDAAGRIIGVIGMVGDITERNKAEEERARSERQFRALMDGSFDFVYVHDLHGTFIDANKACFEKTGYERDELSAITLQSIVHPDDAAKAYQGVFDILKAGIQDRLVEYRIRCKDGSWLDLETSATLLYREGKPYAVQGVGRNITPRKRAEEALRRSEERFRTVFEQASAGMALVDRELRFTKTNAAFRDMLGYTAEELSTKTFREITHPAHLETDGENVMKLIRREINRYRTRKRYIRKDGSTFWADLTITMVFSQMGSVLCGLAMIDELPEPRRRFRFPFLSRR